MIPKCYSASAVKIKQKSWCQLHQESDIFGSVGVCVILSLNTIAQKLLNEF